MKKAEQVASLKAAVIEWLEKNGLNSSVGFYTPKEWVERGEEYCLSADLIMTFEGPFYSVLNNCDPVSLVNEFHELAEQHGYYHEQGMAWYLGFYPC